MLLAVGQSLLILHLCGNANNMLTRVLQERYPVVVSSRARLVLADGLQDPLDAKYGSGTLAVAGALSSMRIQDAILWGIGPNGSGALMCSPPTPLLV